MSAPRVSSEFVVRPVVLLVQEQPTLAEWVLQSMRTDADVRFHHHSEAATAVDRALAIEPTVILQDMALREPNAFDLIAQYRAAPGLAKLPVIALFAAGEIETAARAFQAGATDYVIKASYPVELMPRIRAYSALYLLLREREQLALVPSARPSENREPIVRSSQPARPSGENRAQVGAAAGDDPLASLASARVAEATLATEWKRAARDQQPLSLALIELDFFRQYEQRYGRALADQCLRKLAELVLVHARRPADLAGRRDPDRFTVLLPQTPAAGARALARQLREAVANLSIPHGAREDAHRIVTTSIGVATLVPAPNQAVSLLRAAELALESAQLCGRDAVFHPSIDGAL